MFIPGMKSSLKMSKPPEWKIYAAMIDAMDQGIGQIIDALDKENILENTVILYLQDNGGCAEEIGTMGETRPVAANPGELVPLGKEGIQHVSRLQITREGEPVMKGEGIAGGPNTTYVAYGKVWANASNTPFREYKHWVHEGGIATPLIVHYPGKTGEKNRLVSTPGHLIDIMPTLLDLAGATYPENTIITKFFLLKE
jgi:arylsulfatase A-like enzyme